MTIDTTLLPALRGRFGDWAYYSCLVPLRLVVKRVKFAHELHRNKKLSDMIQRKVRESRAKEIADYLLSDEQRFFNSLVVAVYEGRPRWHEFSEIETGRGQKADAKIANSLSYASRYSLGLLSFSGEERMFALDGQHRLAGMREALERADELGDEELPLILVAHHTDEVGMKRTRHLFTTLNKKAKPVSKGEIIALDESDVMAIVCRQLAEDDNRFSGDCLAFTEQANLPAKNKEQLTTIVNLYLVLKNLFLNRKISQTKSQEELTSGKLSGTDDVNKYLVQATEYFEDIEKIFGDLRAYFQAGNVKRSKILRQARSDQENSEIVFRPVGLLLMSEVYAVLRARTKSRRDTLSLLGMLPKTFGEVPFRGHLWDEKTDTLNTKRRVLVRDIVLYMVGHNSDRSALIRKIAKLEGVPTERVSLPEPVG